MVKETPRKDSIEKFGKGIWGEKKSLRYDGKLERETEKENEKVNEQEWENNSTWTEGSIAQVPKMEINWNWQSSNFFVKNPSVVPCYVLQVYWMKLCKTRDVPGNNIITY